MEPALTREAELAFGSPGDAALNALFDKIFDETIDNAPGFATSLGLDKGAKAHLRSTFDPKPAQQARAEGVARTQRQLAAVKAVNPATLSANGIQLVDEDNRAFLLASSGEEFADTLGSNTNEHLFEVGAARYHG